MPSSFRAERGYWKVHEQKPTFVKNSYGYYEYEIDLSKMALKGSTSSFEPQETHFSSFLLNKNMDKVIYDAMDHCREDIDCVDNMEGITFIKNWHIQNLYA